MFCQNCGSKLIEGALFCSKCGVRVNTLVQQIPDMPVQNVNVPVQPVQEIMPDQIAAHETGKRKLNPEELEKALKENIHKCPSIKGILPSPKGVVLRGDVYKYFIGVVSGQVRVCPTLIGFYSILSRIPMFFFGCLAANIGWNFMEYGEFSYESYYSILLVLGVISALVIKHVSPSFGRAEKAAVNMYVYKIARPMGFKLDVDKRDGKAEKKKTTAFTVGGFVILAGLLFFMLMQSNNDYGNRTSSDNVSDANDEDKSVSSKQSSSGYKSDTVTAASTDDPYIWFTVPYGKPSFQGITISELMNVDSVTIVREFLGNPSKPRVDEWLVYDEIAFYMVNNDQMSEAIVITFLEHFGINGQTLRKDNNGVISKASVTELFGQNYSYETIDESGPRMKYIFDGYVVWFGTNGSEDVITNVLIERDGSGNAAASEEDVPFGYEDSYLDYQAWGGNYNDGWLDTGLSLSLYSSEAPTPECGYITTDFRGNEFSGKLYFLGGGSFRWEEERSDGSPLGTYYVIAVKNGGKYQLELYNTDWVHEVTFTQYEQYIP